MIQGTTYSFPCRPKESAKTLADAKADFVTLQQQVAAAKSILIIGGGPVGIEFAGEVAARYTGAEAKSITLVHGQPALLGPALKPKLASSLASQLKAQGVTVVLGDRVELPEVKTGPVSHQTFTTKSGKRIEGGSPMFRLL